MKLDIDICEIMFVVEMSTDVIEGVPQITGLTCGDAVLYEKLDVSGKDTLKDLLAVTQTLKKYNLVPDTINYDDQGNVTLQYGTITVNLGQATSLTEKVVRMEKIMPNLEGLTGILHLEDWTEDTTDITFEKTA